MKVTITQTTGATQEISYPDGTQVSDGYHTFDELYEHRFNLWIALCRSHAEFHHRSNNLVWRSKLNSNGTSYPGWFLLGMGYKAGEQITYHLPLSRWDECDFAKELDIPEFDGHTAADVFERLKRL